MSEYANRVYLDSNLFIYASASSDVLGEQCLKILNALVKGKIKAVTTLVTFDELFYKLAKLKGFDSAVLFTENFLAMPNLVLSDVTGEIIAMALKVITQHKLAPRDAIHAATAQQYSVDAFVSDDRDFSKVKELKWVDIGGFIAQFGI